MTIEEKNPDSLVVDQLKYLLDTLPVSRAAMKKSEAKISKVDTNDKATFEKNETSVSVKTANDENDDDSLVELNDSMLTADDNCRGECTDQKVPITKSSRILSPLSPISFLMEQSQKKRNAPAVIWQEFNNNGFFGCKVSFGDKFWIAPAKYNRKKEARTMAALMACTELLGDDFLFENIELEKYESWTKESVRKISDEIAEKDQYLKDTFSIANNSSLSYPQNSGMNTESPVNDTTSSNVTISFVALVNEACQKQQIPLPDYEISTETFGAILKYRCTVKNFCEYPSVTSDAMTSKKVAKNEAAKQIYEYMQNDAKIDGSAVKPNRTNPRHSESSSEVIHIIKSIFAIPHEEPLNPATLIPLVMALLSHLSQSCYPEKPVLEGIYEMIDQWKVFLDWKKVNYQN